jgi:glycosyltransferase involved in cell wall biosynthesis
VPGLIGFLHFGPSTGGIHRYSTTLAEAMRQSSDVEVIERTVRGAGPLHVRSLLREVAALRGADATVLQYSRHHAWATGRARLVELALAHVILRFRTVVVLHDLSPLTSVGRLERWCLSLNLLLAGVVVVHGAHERARLPGWPRRRRIATIPHFMEARMLPARDEARRAFGLEPSELVLGILGWVYAQKNHAVALEALALLEPSARLWMIGAMAPDSEPYAEELMRLADRLGVRGRVELTGYLSEEDLNARLAAVDVAICPHHDAAASGSLATLLAAGKPVVATDLPAFREQQRYAGGLLRVVPEPTAVHLAGAVKSIVGRPAALSERLEASRREIAPAAVARRYLDLAHRIGLLAASGHPPSHWRPALRHVEEGMR